MKRITLIILAVAAVLVGSSCSKVDDTTQNPLSLMSMSIIPDYSNGSIKCCPEPFGMSEDGLLSFKVEILPLQYLDQFGIDDKYIYRASFRKVVTKSESDSYDFTLDGTVQKYDGDDFLTASFVLKPDVMAKIKANDYMVSFIIGDATAAQSVSTAFVPLSSNKGTNNNPSDGIIPEGALPGVFTVADPDGIPNTGDETKVHFSKGNLFFDGSRFKFEDNQYSFRGYDSQYNTWGLFGWVGASGLLDGELSQFGASTSVSHADYGSAGNDFLKLDWGYTINDEIWRTLPANEWEFLFKYRTNAIDRYGYATIDNVPGIIILPDSFIDPKTNRDSESFVPSSQIGWDANVYKGENWDEMEEAGAVFLPAAGFRHGSDVMVVGENGKYWSYSSCGEDAYIMSFFEDYVGVGAEMRYSGCSIRLVTESFNINTLSFSIKSNNLGENVQKVGIVFDDTYCHLGDMGSYSYVWELGGDIEIGSKIEFSYQNAGNFFALSGKKVTITYDSEHVRCSEVITLPNLSSLRSYDCELNVPWLLYEDFSTLSTFSSDDECVTSSAGSKDAVAFHNGWSGGRVGGQAGKCVRIAGRRECGMYVDSHYPARMDSAPLPQIKLPVNVEVSFDYGTDRAYLMSSAVNGQTIYVGYVSSTTMYKSGDEDGIYEDENKISTDVLDGSWTSTPQKSKMVLHNIPAGTQNRISWRDDPWGKSEFGGITTTWCYLDNVKAKVKSN